jgi:ribosomal protein L32E
MPLAKNLEELLKHMAPEAAKAQREIWEAKPEIAEQVDKFFVPQAEFSRQLNAKDLEVKAAREDAQKIRDWEKKNRPEFDRAVADAERYRKEVDEWKAKAERVAANRGDIDDTTVDPDQLLNKVLGKLEGRTVSPEKMTELLQAEAKKMSEQIAATMEEKEKLFFEQTVPRGLAWQADMLEAMMTHQQEFGKPMDRAAFSTFMTENKIVSPKEAYERFAEPTRRQKAIDAEVEKKVQERIGKMQIPGVTPGSEFGGDKGFLQLKLEGDKTIPTFDPSSELGDRSAGNAAARELREEMARGAF